MVQQFDAERTECGACLVQRASPPEVCRWQSAQLEPAAV